MSQNDSVTDELGLVYGLAGAVLMTTAAGILLLPYVERDPSSDIVIPVGVGLLFATLPFGLGGFCLCRYRHWTREAIRMEERPNTVGILRARARE